MSRTPDDSVLEELRKLLEHPDDDQLRKVVDEKLAARASHHASIRGAWHNRPAGVAGLALATAIAAAAAVVVWQVTPPDKFDIVAKCLGLLSTILVTVVLLIEDPFHEGCGTQGWWPRLKLQGKVVAALLLVTLVAGLLDISSQRALDTDRDHAMKGLDDRLAVVDARIDGVSRSLAEAAGSIRSITASFEAVNFRLAPATRSVQEIERTIVRLQASLEHMSSELPDLTTDAELRKAIGPLARSGELEGRVRTATQGLATSDELRQSEMRIKESAAAAARAATTDATTALRTELLGVLRQRADDLSQQHRAAAATISDLATKVTNLRDLIDGLSKAQVLAAPPAPPQGTPPLP